jgi:hypothetical protein
VNSTSGVHVIVPAITLLKFGESPNPQASDDLWTTKLPHPLQRRRAAADGDSHAYLFDFR